MLPRRSPPCRGAARYPHSNPTPTCRSQHRTVPPRCCTRRPLSGERRGEERASAIIREHSLRRHTSPRRVTRWPREPIPPPGTKLFGSLTRGLPSSLGWSYPAHCKRRCRSGTLSLRFPASRLPLLHRVDPTRWSQPSLLLTLSAVIQSPRGVPPPASDHWRRPPSPPSSNNDARVFQHRGFIAFVFVLLMLCCGAKMEKKRAREKKKKTHVGRRVGRLR